MTWRRVGAIYLALLVLAGVVAYELRPREPERGHDPAAAEHSLLGVDADVPVRVTFHRDDAAITAARDGERWRVVDPASADVSPDLIAAVVATLTAGQSAEVMTTGDGGDVAGFGLTPPSGEIEVELRGATAPVRILLGATNPTKTAIYAQRAGAPAIYLVGLNLRYYLELIFEAAARR